MHNAWYDPTPEGGSCNAVGTRHLLADQLNLNHSVLPKCPAGSSVPSGLNHLSTA